MSNGALVATRDLLDAVVRARSNPQGLAWLDKSIAELRRDPTVATVLNAYAGAARRMGKRALALSADEQARQRALDAEIRLARWGLDEAARALLLLHLPPSPAEGFEARVMACYEKGDSREQESWLRGLPLLPSPERFLMTAIDACRTNIVPVFEAVACENPYPLRCFPELNFNQMVLKALFVGVALERIVGLTVRRNADLARMANDYVSEREAAGRVVPADIWLVIAPLGAAEALTRVYRYLGHADAAHRYWAAVALADASDARRTEQLRGQLGQETDARVRAAIEAALAR